MIGLHSILQEHGGAIEYDLLTRGIDLHDFFTGRMTGRRLISLIKQLAEDPATNTHRRLGGPWSPEMMLLAAAVDDIRLGNFILAAANSPKGKNPLPLPVPIPRPGVEPQESSRTVKKFGKTNKSPQEVMEILKSFDPPEE